MQRLGNGSEGPSLELLLTKRTSLASNRIVLLLFPTDEAVSVTELQEVVKPLLETEAERTALDLSFDIVLPDGTWAETRKIAKQLQSEWEARDDEGRVTLFIPVKLRPEDLLSEEQPASSAPSATTDYTRSQESGAGVCSFVAAVRLLAVLGILGADAERELISGFRARFERKDEIRTVFE